MFKKKSICQFSNKWFVVWWYVVVSFEINKTGCISLNDYNLEPCI